jgi:mannose-1-phosphate guanylyltransferase
MSKTSAQPWVLVLAGGSGTRFWPASRRRRPKHLLPLLDGGRTLLRATLDRVAPLTTPERTFVVTCQDQRDGVLAECAELPAENVLVEPVPRNTAPAIAFSLVHLGLRGAQAHDPVIVLPADAGVLDEQAYRITLLRAVEAAVREKAIVTLGVRPSSANTGFGWLGLGEAAGPPGEQPELRRVLRFVEKPDAPTAAEFLESGKFWWNAGTFVFRLGYLWYVIGELREDLDLAMATLGACIQQEYGKLPSLSVDHAVMQDAPSLLAVSADFGWSDLGSWDSVAAVMPQVEGGAARAESVVAQDAARNVVWAPGRHVAIAGVEGLVVVVTEDAVLVVPRDHVQSVRDLVSRLDKEGRGALL